MARPGRDGDAPNLVLESIEPPLTPEELELPPLCTPDDVAEVLSVSPTPASPWAERGIETASSWARRFLRRPDLGASGEIVERFFHVEIDGYVNTEGVPASVSVVSVPGSTPSLLSTDLWEYDGEGVRLFANPDFWLLDNSPQRYPWGVTDDHYERVEVTTRLEEAVDPVIRDGVAVAAAAVMTRAPRLAKGISGEKIGDYSYTLAKVESSDPWFEQAKVLLRPHRRVPDLVP